MQNIAENLRNLRNQISAAEHQYGRSAGSVSLLAVSKGQPVEMVKQALQAGQHDFGENYLQEALPKLDLVDNKDVCWHFIGPVQSNKTARLAQHFDWIHSVDRDKVARRLNESRPAERDRLNICLQVNISGETTKAGILPAEVGDFAGFIEQLPRLRLRGLMIIPARQVDFDEQRRTFRQARELFERLQRAGHALDTLSMGMSGDFVAAIAEGSTMLRLGTAIFGPRQS